MLDSPFNFRPEITAEMVDAAVFVAGEFGLFEALDDEVHAAMARDVMRAVVAAALSAPVSGKRTKAKQWSTVERLIAHYGQANDVARALGLAASYITRFRQQKWIPETYALDIEELGVTDKWGRLTAYEVLAEARQAKMRRAAS